ncbi:MAG: hypothetical protein GY943_08665 [Chloroflexi bacterium]|nr:hypothetical protein [Chloroflexota bacterium]
MLGKSRERQKVADVAHFLTYSDFGPIWIAQEAVTAVPETPALSVVEVTVYHHPQSLVTTHTIANKLWN